MTAFEPVEAPTPERLETAFTAALREVVVRVPGARGAIFLDAEGEAIDEYATAPITEIRLLGAHLGVVLSLVRRHAAFLGVTEEVCVEAERAILVVRPIDERYLVLLEAGPDAQLGIMQRELGRAADALRLQM